MNKDFDIEKLGATVVASLDDCYVTRKLRVQNPLGLHARPAANIVRLLRDSQAEVTFTFRRKTVDARSVLGLLMLAAPKNAWITVSVNGPDAQYTIDALEDTFKRKFGEEV